MSTGRVESAATGARAVGEARLSGLRDACTVPREYPEIGVIILTGGGDRAFRSGGGRKRRAPGPGTFPRRP
ncbi:hypothetical protein AB0395_08190 [Streptosporangium sp. NPDC051023]|uniref:hypothetical protein n=1 Tax=Streptosporangium sp. NPDC051023 TaxID=3155410 RepID=UPI00344DEA52